MIPILNSGDKGLINARAMANMGKATIWETNPKNKAFGLIITARKWEASMDIPTPNMISANIARIKKSIESIFAGNSSFVLKSNKQTVIVKCFHHPLV